MTSWHQRIGEASASLQAAQLELDTVLGEIPALRCAFSLATHTSAQAAVRKLRGKEAGLAQCAMHGWHIYELGPFRKAAAKHCTAVLTRHHPVLYRLGIFKKVAAELNVATNLLVTQLMKADRLAYHSARTELMALRSSDRDEVVARKVHIDPSLLEEFHACYRKQAHPTPAHAELHMRHLTGLSNQGGTLHTYHCGYCTGWHVGHVTKAKTAGERRDHLLRAAELLVRRDELAREFLAEKGLPVSVLATIERNLTGNKLPAGA